MTFLTSKSEAKENANSSQFQIKCAILRVKDELALGLSTTKESQCTPGLHAVCEKVFLLLNVIYHAFVYQMASSSSEPKFNVVPCTTYMLFKNVYCVTVCPLATINWMSQHRFITKQNGTKTFYNSINSECYFLSCLMLNCKREDECPNGSVHFVDYC